VGLQELGRWNGEKGDGIWWEPIRLQPWVSGGMRARTLPLKVCKSPNQVREKTSTEMMSSSLRAGL